METPNSTGSVRQTAEFPGYANDLSRLRSFVDWPKQIKQKPEQLADAGFIYTQHGDAVICFSCGGGLHAWADDDVPWEQHALHYVDCKYVKLLKGDNYRDEVVAKLTTADIAKQSDQISEESLDDDYYIVLDSNIYFVKSSSSSGASTCVTKTTTTTISATTADDAKCYSKFDQKLGEYKKCKICYDNDYNTVFLPCAHIIACTKCASSLAACPMCNGSLEKIIKVYIT